MSKTKTLIFTVIMLLIVFGMSWKMMKEDLSQWSETKSLYYSEEPESPKSAGVFMRNSLKIIENLLLSCDNQECLPLIIISGKIKILKNIYQEYNCPEAEAHLKIFIQLLDDKIANALDFSPAERSALTKNNPRYIKELQEAALNTINTCPAKEGP